ncbi:unnamed protein product [Auanema sp. JU1783]|nr:unnamed protein product [Auanema sp. JU1783]
MSRFRLVFMGPSKSGKTSIINRFLHNTFSEKYKETIDDLHHETFRVNGSIINLEIHDTNTNFPDMQKVAIHSAHAICLVFGTDDVNSFKEMSDLWREINMIRSNLEYTPIMIVGNKGDVENKKINEPTAVAFTSHLPSSVRYIEVSAKTNQSIREIFTGIMEVHMLLQKKKGHDEAAKNAMSHPPASPLFLLPEQQFRRNQSFRARSAGRNDGQNDQITPRRSTSLMRRTNNFSFRSRRPNKTQDDCRTQ